MNSVEAFNTLRAIFEDDIEDTAEGSTCDHGSYLVLMAEHAGPEGDIQGHAHGCATCGSARMGLYSLLIDSVREASKDPLFMLARMQAQGSFKTPTFWKRLKTFLPYIITGKNPH